MPKDQFGAVPAPWPTSLDCKVFDPFDTKCEWRRRALDFARRNSENSKAAAISHRLLRRAGRDVEAPLRHGAVGLRHQTNGATVRAISVGAALEDGSGEIFTADFSAINLYSTAQRQLAVLLAAASASAAKAAHGGELDEHTFVAPLLEERGFWGALLSASPEREMRDFMERIGASPSAYKPRMVVEQIDELVLGEHHVHYTLRRRSAARLVALWLDFQEVVAETGHTPGNLSAEYLQSLAQRSDRWIDIADLIANILGG